jgi:hypothetical protein
MYSRYNNYWPAEASSNHDYNYEDVEYDVYLFWPSLFSQVLIPVTAEHENNVCLLSSTFFGLSHIES